MAQSKGAVLLVDDEPVARTVATRMLERLGFEVDATSDGEEALEVFSRHPARYVGVLLDLTMPRMDGDACLREIRRIRPDVPVVLSSGYDEREIAASLPVDTRTTFIHKPYRSSELAAKLQAVLSSSYSPA